MPKQKRTMVALGTLLMAITMISVASSGQSCVDPPNGTMVVWFPFDEVGVSTSANLATGGSGMQMHGPLGIAAGKVAGAASFNGTNQYINAGSYLGISFGPAGNYYGFCNGDDSACSGNFSIDVWVQLPNSQQVGDMVVVDKTASDDSGDIWGYTFLINGINLGLELGDGGFTRYLSPDPLSSLYDGNWHHVAVTVNRLSTTGITFYFDGQALPTRLDPTGRTNSLTTSSAGSNLIIGARGRLKDYFHGNLDELEIFNRELGLFSQITEVERIYDAQSAGKCKPNPGAALSSCVPASSQSVLIQKPNVTAYVPAGTWDVPTTGIYVVPIEPIPVGTPTSISTPNPANSCASNSVTGETVCVGNTPLTASRPVCTPGTGDDIYLITGSTINQTLQSNASGFVHFSGGNCCNCGVAIDPLRNEAVIEVSSLLPPSNTGLEILNLVSDSSFTGLLNSKVAEDIQIDPYRALYLSPSEENSYDLVDRVNNTLVDYSNYFSINGTFDSAGEDCTTGIGLSTIEDTFSLLITDLTQAKTGGGTWSAPSAITTFKEFGNMSSGTDGIAVAPGTQLAIVTSEFGGNEIGVVQLPATSGTGTPSFGDYVAAYLPATPDGMAFFTGYDPHTVTAYVSPNDGLGYGVVASWPHYAPTYLAVIDLQGLLDAPRCNGNCKIGPHEVDPNYDLVGNGVVRYVQVN